MSAKYSNRTIHWGGYLLQMIILITCLNLYNIQYAHSLTNKANDHITDIVTIYLNEARTIDLPVHISEVILSQEDIVSTIIRTPQQIVLIGSKMGTTDIFLYEESGYQVMSMKVHVKQNLEELPVLIEKHFLEKKVRVEGVRDKVIVSGTVRSVSSSDEIIDFVTKYVTILNSTPLEVINRLNILEEQQVTIKVKIAEVNRSATKSLGVQWGAKGNTSIGNVNQSLSATLSNATNIIEVLFGNGSSSPLSTFDELKFSLTALERNSIMRILSEPSLTALSGETASFHAGGNYPVASSIIVEDTGDVKTSYNYHDVGISLKFTPTIINSGRIKMNIDTEVSEFSNEFTETSNNTTIKGIARRAANTTVEVPSGGTIVLAGLMSITSSRTQQGLPVIQNIPGIGSLFRHKEVDEISKELIILTTPYITNAANPDKFSMPTNNFQLPSYFSGKLMNSIRSSGYFNKAQKFLEDDSPSEYENLPTHSKVQKDNDRSDLQYMPAGFLLQ